MIHGVAKSRHHPSPRCIPAASFLNLLQLLLPQLKPSSPFTSNYSTCFLAALHRHWVISLTPCGQVWRSKAQVVHKFVAHPLAALPPIYTVQLPSGPLPILHRVVGETQCDLGSWAILEGVMGCQPYLLWVVWGHSCQLVREWGWKMRVSVNQPWNMVAIGEHLRAGIG